jgi:patatin-like phospholipase/acyl hydrolase
VVEVIILKELMLLVKERMQLDEEPLPKDYFHMIGGSGTGGLLAILLGRFGMSASECIVKYADLSREIFHYSNKRSRKVGTTAGRHDVRKVRSGFGVTTLENAVKRIAQEKHHHQEAKFNGGDREPHCKA